MSKKQKSQKHRVNKVPGPVKKSTTSAINECISEARKALFDPVEIKISNPIVRAHAIATLGLAIGVAELVRLFGKELEDVPLRETFEKYD